MESKAKSFAESSPPSKPQDQWLDEAKKVPKFICQGRFELKHELGAGAHGKIFSGRDKHLKQSVAMDKVAKNKSKFQREIGLMKDVAKVTSNGFPRLINYTSDKFYYYIIMEQLGQNLKELKDALPEKRFCIKTITMIGLQLLTRLEVLHNLNYVHRDLKPANILIGRTKSDQTKIYLIDYGLAKKQVSSQANLPAEMINKVVGTAIYAALSAHMPGSQYDKKDDLESMMYVLAYLHIGTLPWKNCKNNEQGLEKMMKIKMVCTAQDLFGSMPREFSLIFDHIRQTPQDSLCDYQYIEGLFKSVSYQSKFKLDSQFDWIVHQKNSIMLTGASQASLDLLPNQKELVNVGQRQNQTFNVKGYQRQISTSNQEEYKMQDSKSQSEFHMNDLSYHNIHSVHVENCDVDQGGTALDKIQELVEEEKQESPLKINNKQERRKSTFFNPKEQAKKYDINLTVNVRQNASKTQQIQQQEQQDPSNSKNSIHLHLHINHKSGNNESDKKDDMNNSRQISSLQNSDEDQPMDESQTFKEFELGIKNEYSSNSPCANGDKNKNLEIVQRQLPINSNNEVLRRNALQK